MNKLNIIQTASYLKVETNKTAISLAGLFFERGRDGETFKTNKDAYEYALEYIREEQKKGTVKEYYVLTMHPYSLGDTMGGGRLKTPCKYFNSYKDARIFQLTLAEDSDLVSKGDIGELNEYRRSEPEYFV